MYSCVFVVWFFCRSADVEHALKGRMGDWKARELQLDIA